MQLVGMHSWYVCMEGKTLRIVVVSPCRCEPLGPAAVVGRGCCVKCFVGVNLLSSSGMHVWKGHLERRCAVARSVFV